MLFSPSFLFYCYKNELNDSVDEIAVKNTHLENFTTICTGNNILYLMYDKNGNPVKTVRLKRFGGDLPDSLSLHDKAKPVSNIKLGRMWMEKWVPAKLVDPMKIDEMVASIDWLIDFQIKNQLAPITKDEKILEVNKIRNDISKISELNTSKNKKLLDNYQSYLETLNINKTAEHGDFWHGNVLMDSVSNKILVIDWEYFSKEGNPFFDFTLFLLNGIKFSSKNLDEFESNLSGNGKFKPILTILKNKINKHFGFELNLHILIPYVLLCFILRKQLERGIHDKEVIFYKKLLNVLLSK